MASEREHQMQEAAQRAEAERAYAIKDAEELEAAYDEGWQEVDARKQALEPILHELIARRVRAVMPDATAVAIEPTDQGGPGWVLVSGPDELHDDDVLSVLLRDLGEFMSSEDHPPQELVLPAKA